MNADEATRVALDLATMPKVITIEILRHYEEPDRAHLFAKCAKVENGTLLIAQAPGETHSGGPYVAGGLLPRDDYRICFADVEGGYTQLCFNTLEDFEAWRTNRRGARQKMKAESQQRARRGSQQIRELMKLANYKNRTFAWPGQFPTCRGCGFTYNEANSGPSSIYSLLNDHRRLDCPAQLLVKEIVRRWKQEGKDVGFVGDF